MFRSSAASVLGMSSSSPAILAGGVESIKVQKFPPFATVEISLSLFPGNNSDNDPWFILEQLPGPEDEETPN